MIFNYDLLHKDILKKLSKLEVSQSYFSKTLGISRSTIQRIYLHKNITIKTLIIVIDWLEKNLNDYVVKYKRPCYIEKRLKEIQNNKIKK